MGSLPFLPPLKYVVLAQLQIMCYYMANLYLKIWPMRLGFTNDIHLLCLEDTNGKDPKKFKSH